MTAVKLDTIYAIDKTEDGKYEIYEYEIDPNGSIRHLLGGPSITLDAEAMTIVSDVFCGDMGGCDFLKDAQSELESLKKLMDKPERL
jgi:hypothetical protein